MAEMRNWHKILVENLGEETTRKT